MHPDVFRCDALRGIQRGKRRLVPRGEELGTGKVHIVMRSSFLGSTSGGAQPAAAARAASGASMSTANVTS